MVLETERSWSCAFAGSGEFCGILTISTAKNLFMILEERVCRSLTNGPRAFITAMARMGSLL